MENWSYEEFLGFVLTHAANSDFEVDKKEVRLIEKNVGPVIAQSMAEYYDELSDMDRIDIILAYKDKYYPTEESKNELLSRISEIYQADNDFSSSEQMTIMMLRKLLK